MSSSVSIASSTSSVPTGPAIGTWLLRKTGYKLFETKTFYKAQVLFFTYLAYTAYHLSRRPMSVVKSVLHHQNCTNVLVPGGTIITSENSTTWCDWHPFEGENGHALLGATDSIYLISYSFCMFFSGWLAERMNLRYFLAIGMILSGFFTYVFGLAYYYDIHNYWFFVIIQLILGAFQSTGWPACLAAVGNWFGHSSKKGLILGIWNSHTNVGNILGAVVAGAFVNYNWGLSFIVPGIIIAACGFWLFLFLVPYPEEVDMPSLTSQKREHESKSRSISTCNSTSQKGSQYKAQSSNQSECFVDAEDSDESTRLISNHNDDTVQNDLPNDRRAISIIDALKVPGVLEYSASLFFSKLVSYTFLYWLPKYIENSTHLDPEYSAYMSAPFDVGGFIGAILAGYLADRTGTSGLVCIGMLALLLPSLVAYLNLAHYGLVVNIILQGVVGIMINGPYCLITTSVAADLGNKVTSSDAMATITAIVDGTGSIGAAVGPFIAGLIANGGWDNVFYMVMISDVISMLLLFRIGKSDITMLLQRRRERRTNGSDGDRINVST